MVYVSHDAAELRQLATQIVMLETAALRARGVKFCREPLRRTDAGVAQRRASLSSGESFTRRYRYSPLQRRI